MAGLFPDNPFSQYIDPRRNALMGFSAGMLAGDPSQAMLGAMQGSGIDRERAMQAQQQAQAEQERNATMEWVRQNAPQFANLPPAMAFEAAMKQLNQAQGGGNAFEQRFAAGQQYGLSGDALNTFALTGSVPGTTRSNVTYGTTPVWGRDSTTGQMGYGVTGSDGTFKMVDTGGFQPLGPYDVNAEKAAGTAFGKETGGAQFDLPSAELATTQTLSAIDAIRAEKKGMDEQFGNILGVPQQLTPAVPGTDKAKFQVAVERGTNLAFLQAREMLRGGGQITDFESRKAETAITNMQLAMEKGDKAQFEAALTTFEQAVRDGLVKIKQQAGTMPGYRGAPPAAAPMAGPNEPQGVWVYNPATGKLEQQ